MLDTFGTMCAKILYMIRAVICECGNDTYEDTFDFLVVSSAPIWKCRNCGKQTPRRIVHRKTLHTLTLDAVLAISAEWETVNDKLEAMVANGTPNGCLSVHASYSNYCLNRLRSGDKLTRTMLKVLIDGAREDLNKAKKFVGME